MSGGRFDYDQSRIEYIADALEEIIGLCGKTRNQLHDAGKEEVGNGQFYRGCFVDWIDEREHLASTRWRDPDANLDEEREYVRKHNNEAVFDFSPETIKEFKNGLKALRKAYVYAQRIDWLLSGDDGEDSFHERLKEELKGIK